MITRPITVLTKGSKSHKSFVMQPVKEQGLESQGVP